VGGYVALCIDIYDNVEGEAVTGVAPALRPMLPADVAMLVKIFRSSIEELAAEDYSPGQIEAWMSVAEDEQGFGARLQGMLTLVATIGGLPAGFVSLKGTEEIDMLYVAAGVARQGIATLLVGAVEKLAGARGAKRLTADASDTARPFFEVRGFVAERRNTVILGDEWLGNTTMTKTLVASSPSVHQ